MIGLEAIEACPSAGRSPAGSLVDDDAPRARSSTRRRVADGALSARDER